MSIWNKVLVGLIIVASLGLFYLGMQTLKTHKYWRESARKHEAKLEPLPKEIENLKFGTVDGGCLRDLRVALAKQLAQRGRVWNNWAPQQIVNPQTGEVRISTDAAGPHGITDKMTLTVFEARDPKGKGRFLGEFKVKAIAEKQIVLEPAMTMTPDDLARLQQSKGPWTLCELMPTDSHEVFAGLGEKELREILPAHAVEQFVNDGKEGKTRKLRDYGVLLKEFDRQRAILVEKQNTVARHKQELDAAVADAKRQVQFRQNELAALKTELAALARERDAALAHQKALEKEITDRQSKIARLIEENRAAADEIAKAQFEAVGRIERQAKVATK
jgi:hypothetical protein